MSFSFSARSRSTCISYSQPSSLVDNSPYINMISTIFDGAAHVTVAGCIGAFFFKQTVVDRTSKAVKEAENITPGLVISEFCISVAVLVLASNKTARILLSKDAQPPPRHNLAELNVLLICNNTTDFSTATESISLNPIATEPCSTPPASISSNPIANDSRSTSPSTTCSTLCTPLLPILLVQNAKHLSIDSDTTLVDHDDDFVKDFSDADLSQESTFSEDDGNCSSGSLLPGMEALTIDDLSGPSQRMQLQPIILKDRHRTMSTTMVVLPLMDASTQTTTSLSLGSIPPQIVTPRLKPPNMKWHQNLRPGRHKHKSRSTRLAAVCDSMERAHAKQLEHTTMIDHLEQLHNELLADQAALVDGWAAAMAQLGLTSMLAPGPPLLHQNTPSPGNSIENIQD
ncbi:hypothetical protein EV702DRAFT_1143480 [Suillus placidus]|uniref:Uncharacterized protein n=1 Tax=Suillus placidus TaxID=48579 RepID=A0A9P6ZJE6_9AGAM|nr:hypothetical protein EV702DRAFT_1143480 [Suillus placidus]